MMKGTDSMEWHWQSFTQLSGADLYEVLAARQKVFLLEQKCLYLDIDGLDRDAHHLLGWRKVDGKRCLAAYLRCLRPGAKFAEMSLGRVLTTSGSRGAGIGIELMEKGITHLRPMTMAQVADVVGVHETTVSRAVSGKYIETPQGVFEMKYFFTAGLQTASGTDVSNASVKDMVAEIFKNENPAKPLSDQEAVKLLTEKGIHIARRTIAKYRDELGVLPSNLRKVY